MNSTNSTKPAVASSTVWGVQHVNRALVVDGFAKEYRGGKKE